MSLAAGVPRITLGHWPTPLEELPRLTKQLGGPQLFIKRDDQTGLATGGNKTRALEFLVSDALDRDSDVLITAGSAQSNHARQTAAAAARCGLTCHLILRGQRPTDVTGNLLLNHLLGACVHWAGDRPLDSLMNDVAHELRVSGRKPHILPYGGSSDLGILGYAVGIEELVTQIDQQQVSVDRIVVASASGGQQAGFVLGKKALGLDMGVLGMATEKRRVEAMPFMLKLVESAASRLGLNLPFEEADFEFHEEYLGKGYATPAHAEWEAIQLLARSEGILLDPVYTGRAFAGMVDLIRQGVIGRDETVCFWHTGGTAGLFPWSDWLVSNDSLLATHREPKRL